MFKEIKPNVVLNDDYIIMAAITETESKALPFQVVIRLINGQDMTHSMDTMKQAQDFLHQVTKNIKKHD